MEKQVKILILGIILGIVVLSVVLYTPSLEATCQNWSSALYNKYYTLNAQFESLYKTDPSMLDQSWEDATIEWMTYQRELYGYSGLCYGDLTGANDLNNARSKIIMFRLWSSCKHLLCYQRVYDRA